MSIGEREGQRAAGWLIVSDRQFISRVFFDLQNDFGGAFHKSELTGFRARRPVNPAVQAVATMDETDPASNGYGYLPALH